MITDIFEHPDRKPTPKQVKRAIEYCNRAQQYYNRTEYDAAIQLLNQAIEITPDISNAYSLLASCYLKQKRFRLANWAALKEIMAHPEHKHAQDILAESEFFRQGRGEFVTFEQTEPPETWPSVSLCMIVKNEEKNLADCLRSVGDFASELIIVDTGSTDRTVEIAKSFGARVEYFEWIDDFAAARNESIKYATGEYIFILDGDERILPIDLIRLKWAVALGNADIIKCLTNNIGAASQAYLDRLPVTRIFRNDVGLYFENALHHNLSNEVIVQKDLMTAYTDIVIQHYGYRPEHSETKKLRNQEVAYKAWQRNPDDILSELLYYLFSSTNDENALYVKYADLFSRIPDDFFPFVYLAQAYFHSHLNFLNNGEEIQARSIINQMLVDFPLNLPLWLAAGYSYLHRLKDYSRAISIFRHATRLSYREDELYNTLVNGYVTANDQSAHRLLVKSWILDGNISKAKDEYIRWQEEKPAPISEQDVLSVNELFSNGDFDKICDRFQNGRVQNPDILRVLSLSEAQLQRYDDAFYHFSGFFLLTGCQPALFSTLAMFEMEAGRPEIASRIGMLALDMNPAEVKMMNMLGVIAMQNQRSKEGLEWFIMSLALDPENNAARDNLLQACRLLNLNLMDVITQQAKEWIRDGNDEIGIRAYGLSLGRLPEENEILELMRT